MSTVRIVDFRHGAAPSSAPIDPTRLIAGNPQATVDNRYSDPSQQFHTGIWSSTPGKWRIRYTEHEFCHLLEGHVRLTAEGGASVDFHAGDAFVIPAGFVGTWETVSAARKYYAIFEPESAAG